MTNQGEVGREYLIRVLREGYAETALTKEVRDQVVASLKRGAHIIEAPLESEEVLDLLAVACYVSERPLDPGADDGNTAFHFGMSVARMLLLEIARLKDEVVMLRIITGMPSLEEVIQITRERTERGRCSAKVAESA